MHIRDVMKDSIKVEIDKKPTISEVPPTMVARHENGKVILFVDDMRIELNTYHAHRIGLAIGTAMPGPDEVVKMTINGRSVELFEPLNFKMSGALLRKADAADEFQRNSKR